jgi:hypothetical protein
MVCCCQELERILRDARRDQAQKDQKKDLKTKRIVPIDDEVPLHALTISMLKPKEIMLSNTLFEYVWHDMEAGLARGLPVVGCHMHLYQTVSSIPVPVFSGVYCGVYPDPTPNLPWVIFLSDRNKKAKLVANSELQFEGFILQV